MKQCLKPNISPFTPQISAAKRSGCIPFQAAISRSGQLTTGESAMESLIYSRIVKTEAGQEVLVLLNSTITPINPTVQTIQVQLALITIVALLLSLVLAVVLSQKISKPIIKTNNAAKELAQGNYGCPLRAGITGKSGN